MWAEVLAFFSDVNLDVHVSPLVRAALSRCVCSDPLPGPDPRFPVRDSRGLCTVSLHAAPRALQASFVLVPFRSSDWVTSAFCLTEPSATCRAPLLPFPLQLFAFVIVSSSSRIPLRCVFVCSSHLVLELLNSCLHCFLDTFTLSICVLRSERV